LSSTPYSLAIDHPSTAIVSEGQWLRSKKWDLMFISLSAALVAVPILTFYFANSATPSINAMLAGLGIKYTWDADASRNLVNGIIAFFIGGPHMYATYTRTALESNFSSKHRLFLGLSLLIPIGVIYFGVYYFQWLITVFFFWASIHIMHQMAFIMECYNKKAKFSLSIWSRLIDYAVVFSSLYPIATYRFIHDDFHIGPNKILFPDFLKIDFVFYAILGFFLLSLILFIWKTIKEIQEGVAHYPKILLMSLTVIVAFFIPAFPNLDVAFQGFNTWHSFQYLGLTYYINRLQHEKGKIGTKFIDHMSEDGKTWWFYFFNVGLTLGAVTIIAALIYLSPRLGLSFDQCYYIVVLSFLLMHYFHDHLLFTDPEAVVAG
jgi:hypothetical protein